MPDPLDAVAAARAQLQEALAYAHSNPSAAARHVGRALEELGRLDAKTAVLVQIDAPAELLAAFRATRPGALVEGGRGVAEEVFLPRTDEPVMVSVDEIAREEHEAWRRGADRCYSAFDVPWEGLTAQQRHDSSRQTRRVLQAAIERLGIAPERYELVDGYDGFGSASWIDPLTPGLVRHMLHSPDRPIAVPPFPAAAAATERDHDSHGSDRPPG
jgi:hypothetical protein